MDENTQDAAAPKRKIGVTAKEGFEFRGMRVRLYPDAETERKLHLLADDLRYAWNWLVGRNDEALEAGRRHVARVGLVSARPARPDYDGLEPDESHALKLRYRDACMEWSKAAYKASKAIEGCRPYKLKEWQEHFGAKHDYQLLMRVVSWRHGDDSHDVTPHAGLYQALVRNYFTKSERRKTRKKVQDHMPIKTRSGTCFKLGEFGARGKNPSFYNCQVSINGLKMRGRLPGCTPKGRVLEGVTITREADGWYGAILVEQPFRVLPASEPGTVVGIDVGLVNIAAMSNGIIVENARDHAYKDRLKMMQAAKQPTGRLQQKFNRRVKHDMFTKVLKAVAKYEVIKIENISSDLGQRGSELTSVMRTVQTMLQARYKDRVRAVNPAFTSQDCSQCGKRDKVAWDFDIRRGPVGTCTGCGLRLHRDVNAARNIAARPSIT